MNNLQIFSSEEFGKIRTVIIDGEPWFCMTDICKALEISNTSQAKTRLNADGVITNEVIDSIGRKQNANFVNEPNMYKLIFQSRKESAERFTDWVTSEVLPAIRKTGSYQKPMTVAEQIQLLAQGNQDHEERIEKLENTMTIDYGQQKYLGDLVSKVVIEVLGGKKSNAYDEIGKKVFAECNRDVKTYFDVNARNNIPKLRYQEAVEYIKEWTPCANTKIMIRDYNAQIRMQVSPKVKKQFSTSLKDLENIGIHITEQQYSDLCEINLFMKGMPDIPVYNILLVLKTLGLIPTKMPDQKSNKERNGNLDERIKSGFERKFGKIEK